jgi:hypothetical protein
MTPLRHMQLNLTTSHQIYSKKNTSDFQSEKPLLISKQTPLALMDNKNFKVHHTMS